MIVMATALLAASEATVTLSAIRLEAENGRPIVRAVVSGPTAARVERSGPDLVLVLPGAHPKAGLRLPFPGAGIAEITLDDSREGARVRIRLDTPLDYELRQEPGLASLALAPWPPGETAPAVEPAASPGPREGLPSQSATRDVRELYAKILPPPAGAGPEEGAAGGGGAAEPAAPGEGLHFGPFRLAPSVAVSYLDADTALLDTPQPVRDRYFQIEPRIECDLGPPTAGSRRLQVTYNPRFRLRTAFAELRHATHILNAAIEVPVGPTVTVRASHHYANGVLETTEVDPGREYFFRLSPFTRNQTTGGLSLTSGGRLGFEVRASRDTVRLQDQAGFFDHRSDTAAGTLNYELGSTSRAYFRYQWDRVPPSAERPIIESRASSVALGLAGDVLPLVTGEVVAGYSRLSAPLGGSGGTRFSGLVLDARLRKRFTPATSLGLFGRRGTYPSGFEQNAFYVTTGAGVAADLGLPLFLMVHGGVDWQRNAYRVAASGLAVPRRDDIVSWSAGVGRSLTRWSYLRADYRVDRRSSNLAAFETNGHVLIVQVGLGYLGASPAGEVAR